MPFPLRLSQSSSSVASSLAHLEHGNYFLLCIDVPTTVTFLTPQPAHHLQDLRCCVPKVSVLLDKSGEAGRASRVGSGRCHIVKVFYIIVDRKTARTQKTY